MHNFILNKLCNIISEDIFQKKENKEIILDKRLVKVLVLLYFMSFNATVICFPTCLIPNAEIMFQ